MVSFDAQATTFDARAGLPPTAAADVAAAVVSLVGLAEHERLVEVGAGSGEIGCHLATRADYLGFDSSPAMVEVFRVRAPEARVVVADGNHAWPVETGTARAIFASRCLHLLSLEHVLAEIERVGAPTGVTVLVGRVMRDDTSVRMWMRRQMRDLLRDAGVEGRRGGGRIVRDLVERGVNATPVAPQIAAQWSVTTSPADALAAWVGKDGLAGVAVDDDTKRSVLERLRELAQRELGDLDRRVESTEEYVLSGAHFTGGS